MKKVYLFAFMVLMSMVSVAQEKMKITFVDGKVVEYNVEDVIKVSFEVETRLDVSPSELSFESEKGSKTISISSNSSWAISSNASWLSVNSARGEGDATVSVSVLPNSSSEIRRGVLTISAGDKTSVVDVIQEGAPEPYIKLSDYSYLVSASGGSVTLSVFSNTSWSVESNQDWATPTTTSGTGNGQITVNVGANTLKSARSAMIKVTGSGVSDACGIVQEPAYITLLYAEPCVDWGCSKTMVKNYMNGYTIYRETDTSLSYLSKYKEVMTQYGFENSKLYMSRVTLLMSEVTVSEIDGQLKENYVFLSENNGNRVYASADAKTLVLFSSDDDVSAYVVTYVDANYLVSSKLYEEPFIPWGTARTTVKSLMAQSGYTLYSDNDSYTSNYALTYYGKYDEVISMYLFDSSRKLEQISFAFDASTTSLLDVKDYVENTLGYIYVQENSGTYYYITSDYSSYVVIEEESMGNGASAIYLAYINPGSSSSAKARTGKSKINIAELHGPKDFKIIDFEEFKKAKMSGMIRKIKSTNLNSLNLAQ